jgi:hypothetical protein
VKNDTDKIQQKKKIEDMQREFDPMIIEANEIAKTLGRNIIFEFQYAGCVPDEGFSGVTQEATDDLLKQRPGKAEIRVENHELRQIYVWTPEKFRARFDDMREMLSHGFKPEEDPFTDKIEPLLIGEGFYKLEALANLIDNPVTPKLIGSTFEVHGNISLNLVPVNPDGSGGDTGDLDFIPEDPTDLIDQRIDFIVQIDNITDLPEDMCRNVFVEYQFYLD